MSYWPWYSRLESSQRYEYLAWLASGKRTLPRLEGYLFLYYYALERRVLADGKDAPLVISEIHRLREMDAPRKQLGQGKSFRNYSTSLLWFLVGVDPSIFDEQALERVIALSDLWDAQATVASLGWFAHYKRPLSSKLALRVAREHPNSQRSVVVQRVQQEFTELFARRYRDAFGDGIVITMAQQDRRVSYRPASNGLSLTERLVGTPSYELKQFNALPAIWNSCIQDLRRYSRAAPSSGAEVTISEWEALPEELRTGVEHPLTEQVLAMLESRRRENPSHTTPQGDIMIPAGHVAGLLGLEQRPKLTAVQSRKIAQTLEDVGFCVEPDARSNGLLYPWSDEVAVFPRLEDTPLEASRYNAAAGMLRLGLAVAQADGTVDSQEAQVLEEQIEATFGLPPFERRRLAALRELLARSGADIAPIARKLESTLTVEQRGAVGRLLVVIAAANGTIDRAELKALRRCFRALELAPDLLDRTIAEIAPDSATDLVTVKPGEPRSDGEPIPGEGELRLNREAISSIMAETREVARLLADAMNEHEEDAGQASTIVAPASPASMQSSQPSTLDRHTPPPRYAAFYAELVTHAVLKRTDAESMARRHKAMLAGALETINEWALEQWGRPLVDETDEELTIDRSLL